MARYGRFADFLRTLCGLTRRSPHWDVAGQPQDAASHPASVPAAAGRRKGASRPYGIGLRPTLPPTGGSRMEAGYGKRRGVWMAGHVGPTMAPVSPTAADRW